MSITLATPAVLSARSTDHGIVCEWDFWRSRAEGLTELLPDRLATLSLVESLSRACQTTGDVLRAEDLLRLDSVKPTLYAVHDGVQVRYRISSQSFDDGLNTVYAVSNLNRLEDMLLQDARRGYFPTDVDFIGRTLIQGVGTFDEALSFTLEVFEDWERIRVQTRSTAFMTCSLTGYPQLALYAANGPRLERAMALLDAKLLIQGFNRQVCFPTRYGRFEEGRLLNHSTLEPMGDQILNVVDWFDLSVDYEFPQAIA